LDVQLVECRSDRLELGDLRTLEAETEGDLAGLVWLQTGGRMNVDRQNFLGRLVRHFFDVHATGGGRDQGDAPALAIERQRNIHLAIDLRPRFDVNALDGQAFLAGLFSDEARAEHAFSRGAHRTDIAGELYATRLAAATGVHLCLHHPNRTTDRLGCRNRFRWGCR